MSEQASSQAPTEGSSAPQEDMTAATDATGVGEQPAAADGSATEERPVQANEIFDAEEDGTEPASFDELRDQGDENGPGDLKLEMILDVPVTLTVEVGRTRVSVRDLLKLNRGSVVELDQLVSEPMSLLVNDTLVARGEPVMVNERFGIRLTDVVSAEQRIRKLG